MSKFLMIQLGYSTFGEGETAEAAREDSREWLENAAEADSVPVRTNAAAVRVNHAHGDLVIVPRHVADELGNY